jgi:hypothetical protein
MDLATAHTRPRKYYEAQQMSRPTLAILVLVVAMAVGVNAASISLFNTGVDPAGVPLPGASIDPHWSVVGSTAAVVNSNQSPIDSGFALNYAQSPSSQ